jgi:hypothetical protein
MPSKPTNNESSEETWRYFNCVQGDDLKVVPLNREILVDWDGHINVEYVRNSYTVLYIYKYLVKGNKKVNN